MPDHIDHNSKQVAVLLLFPEGYTVQQVREFIARSQASTAATSIPLNVDITVKEFNPTYGGVCIYQP